MKLGEFLTPGQIEEVKRLTHEARTTPVMTTGNGRQDWASQAWDRLYRRIGEMAGERGLPAEPYYGLTNDGEIFVAPDWIEEFKAATVARANASELCGQPKDAGKDNP